MKQYNLWQRISNSLSDEQCSAVSQVHGLISRDVIFGEH